MADEEFDDLSAVLGRRTLRLPINGKWHTFVEPCAEDGLWVNRLVLLGERAADDDATVDAKLKALLGDEEEEDLYQRVLGDKWTELSAAGVTLSQMQHIGQTVAVWLVYGKEVAKAIWRASGGDGQGEAEGPASSSRRASGEPAATTPSGAGRGTKRSRKQGRGGRTSSKRGRS